MTDAKSWLVIVSLVGSTWRMVGAQVETKSAARDTVPSFSVYGFVQADGIYDFLQNNPAWFDVNRPSQLPAFNHEFGGDGRTWFSVRQTRFGVSGSLPARGGTLSTTLEFDFFGVEPEAGQTTLRLQLGYGQWGKFGAGQLWSPFMDIDVFPECLDYWGPNGMVFLRNVQAFWQPVKRDDGTRVTIALERPGASGDAGIYRQRIEVENIKPRFPLPALTAEYRLGRPWGYVELAGVVRSIHWDDVLDDAFDLSGRATGWGAALSSNVYATRRDVIRLLGVYGAGVENYFNDAPVDVGAKRNTGDPRRPVRGVPLPDLGIVAFLDHRWSERLASAIGYSRVNVENSDAQARDAFRSGQYALANLLFYPVTGVMMGAELQWSRRANFADGFRSRDYRLQLSFRVEYAQRLGVGRESAAAALPRPTGLR